MLRRLAANCYNVVKQDQLFKDAVFNDCPETELEKVCVQFWNLLDQEKKSVSTRKDGISISKAQVRRNGGFETMKIFEIEKLDFSE